jgi:hypothetical protein
MRPLDFFKPHRTSTLARTGDRGPPPAPVQSASVPCPNASATEATTGDQAPYREWICLSHITTEVHAVSPRHRLCPWFSERRTVSVLGALVRVCQWLCHIVLTP